MLSKLGQISYSYGSNNVEGGSADCSAMVQWAFQQVLVKMNDGFVGDFLEAFKKEVKLCTGG
jgi:hypothetical protein